MNDIFVWNQAFLTGLATVDQQHRRLVELINDIGELAIAAEPAGSEQFARAHAELLDYAARHFEDEERLMEQAGLDSRHVETHRAAHREFAAKAVELGRSGGYGPDEVHATLHYLVRWLAFHILGIDQRMARQIASVRSGRGAAEAFEAEQESEELQHSTEPLLQAMEGLYYLVTERNRELRELNSELESRVRARTSELESANRLLRSLAVHDELTGLFNRRGAMDTLVHALGEARDGGRPLSVLLIDADGFKQVNDRFGHAEGDKVLRLLARRLRETARTSDVVCRMGGDEFLVICTDTPARQAERLAHKILAARDKYEDDEGRRTWGGGVSIGIAGWDDTMACVEDLLEVADAALYEAKRAGRGRHHRAGA